MKRFAQWAGSIVVLHPVSACATGPSLRDSQAAVTHLPSNMGRIFFYREASPFGAAIQPSVFVENRKVGDSVPGGVFYSDFSPGRYKVWVETEVEKSVMIDLAAGQTRYVKMEPGFGWLVGRVHLSLVEQATADQEMQALSLVQAAK